MERVIDIHCHPTLKPFGHSFKNNPTGKNSKNINSKSSIWHHDPPTGADILFEKISGIAKFRQSDFTNMLYGDVSVVILSLYPFEKGFVRNKLGENIAVDAMVNFVNSFSKDFIDYAQDTNNYFSDLEKEYDYLKQLNKQIVDIHGVKSRYVLINSLDEIDDYNDPDIQTIFVILSIEGGHVFDCGYPGKKANRDTVIKNVKTVKSWDHPPIFVSPAHHFYSELCGHAESLNVKVVDWVTNQEYMMNTGFTDLGKEVVQLLLSKEEGIRIYIDVKHMSVQSRREFYEMIDNNYSDQNIPIIVSHGAVNGLESFTNPNHVNNPHLKRKLLDTDINIFDEEIIRIEKSNGLLGIQIDERRICSKSEKKDSNKLLMSKRKRKRVKSKLVWNQIQYIAELLDSKGLSAWDIQSIGSDFDGGVNVVNHFWTSREFSELGNYLEYHATKFLDKNQANLHPFNRLNPELIIDKFMGLNAENFINEVR